MRHLHARQMADQHPVRMQRALGRSRRAGRIDHHRRLVGIGVARVQLRYLAQHHGIEAEHIPVRSVGRDDQRQARHVTPDRGQLGDPGRVGDEGPRARILEPVTQRVGAEQGGERQRDGADLVNRHMRDRHRRPLRQEDRDAVPCADAPPH